MGIFRGGLLVIASVLFFIVVFFAFLFLTLGLSLNYNVIKPQLTESVASLAGQIGFGEKIDEIFPAMQKYCEGNSEYVFNMQGQTFSVSCDSIKEGKDAIIFDTIGSYVDDIYYKKYDCRIFECVSSGSFSYLISEQARDYWFSKFYLALGIFILLGIFMFFLVENKSNMFVIAGALMIADALIFVKIDYILDLILKLIISNAPQIESFGFSSIKEVSLIFFTKSYSVFLIFFIIGIVTLLIGIVLKFFKIGFWISEFFSKFKKEKDAKTEKIVQKESVKPVQKKRTAVSSSIKRSRVI